MDTYEIVRPIEGLELLPTKDEREKITLFEQMVLNHLNLETLIQP